MPIDLRKSGIDLTKKPVNIQKLDLVGIIDISGSMGERYEKGTRYTIGVDHVANLLGEVAKYDDDGADVLFFDNRLEIETGVTPAKMASLAKKYGPRGSTALHQPLQWAFDKYLPAMPITKTTSGGWFSSAKTEVVGYEKMSPAKQVCIICFTDGVPDDQNAVASCIVDATKRIKKDSDLGILFIQVGDVQSAKEYLERLNSNLKSEGAEFDVVAVCNLADLVYSRFTPLEYIQLAFNG